MDNIGSYFWGEAIVGGRRVQSMVCEIYLEYDVNILIIMFS